MVKATPKSRRENGTRNLDYHRGDSHCWSEVGGIQWLTSPEWEQDKLFIYTPHKVNAYGWIPFFTPWLKGTVLSNATIGYVIFYTTLCMLVAFNAFGLSEETRKGAYHLLSHLLEEGPIKLSTIVIFPLGLFVSLVVNRVFNAYNMYNQLCRATIDCAVNFATLVVPFDNSEFDERFLFIRRSMTRYLKLGHRLTLEYVRELEGHPLGGEVAATEENFLQELIRCNVLTECQMALIKGKKKKYVMVYSWLASLAQKALINPVINCPAPVVGRVHDKCLSVIELADELVEAVQVKIPYSYVALLTALVRIYMLIVAVQHGFFMGKHGRDYFKESKLGSYSNVVDSFGETVTCTGWILILSVFFNGLLELHGQLDNPFGDHCLHMAREMNTIKIEETLDDVMYESKAYLPPDIDEPWLCALDAGLMGATDPPLGLDPGVQGFVDDQRQAGPIEGIDTDLSSANIEFQSYKDLRQGAM